MKKTLVGATEHFKHFLSKQGIYLILVVALIVVITIFSSYFYSFNYQLSKDPATWGQFGDYVGGLLNPILSFLALIAVVMSLRSQSEEVEQARLEARSAIDMQREQTEIFQQQSFESVFFGLLQLHTKNVDRTNVVYGNRDLYGERAFAFMNKDFNFDNIYQVLEPPVQGAGGGGNLNIPKVKQYSEMFMDKYGSALVHYFRIIEEVLDYIGERKFPKPGDDLRYASILVSVLSLSELECFLFYSISEKGVRAKRLAIRYDVFKGLPERTYMYCARATLNYVEN